MANSPGKGPNRTAEEDAANRAWSDAEGRTYLPVDEAVAVPMPDSVEHGWHVREYQNRAEEAAQLYTAQGEEVARKFRARAAEWSPAANDETARHQNLAVAEQSATTQLEADEAFLGMLAHKPAHAAVLYPSGRLALIVGDIAGAAAAMVYLGEPPLLAGVQALSVGAAALVAGLIGADVRNAARARDRAARHDGHELTAEQQKYASFFTGSPTEVTPVAIKMSLSIALLITLGIVTLRTSVTGLASGVLFGSFALAVCCASFALSHHFANDVADALDRKTRKTRKAAKATRKAARARVVRKHAKATAVAKSIDAEYAARAQAARRSYAAQSDFIYQNNPGRFGDGPAKGTTKPAIILGESAIEAHTVNGHRG